MDNSATNYTTNTSRSVSQQVLEDHQLVSYAQTNLYKAINYKVKGGHQKEDKMTVELCWSVVLLANIPHKI